MESHLIMMIMHSKNLFACFQEKITMFTILSSNKIYALCCKDETKTSLSSYNAFLSTYKK